jgi:hypothetical protein
VPGQASAGGAQQLGSAQSPASLAACLQ